jgi:hypothetical protein
MRSVAVDTLGRDAREALSTIVFPGTVATAHLVRGRAKPN